jgi:hypothetical protein
MLIFYSNHRAKHGVLEWVFLAMRDVRLIGQAIDMVSPDSTAVKVHPDKASKRTLSDRQENKKSKLHNFFLKISISTLFFFRLFL